MFKITNNSKTQRQYWNPYKGKNIVLNPGETSLIQKMVVVPGFKIEKAEKKVEVKKAFKKKNIVRMKENGRRCMDGNMSNIDQ